MIRSQKPVSFAETIDLIKDKDSETVNKIRIFIKKFCKISIKEEKALLEELRSLNIIKLKEEDYVKIIDFLPEDLDDLRKIFTGSEISPSQEELNKILEIVQKHSK